jgi:hypothetical protein
MAYNEFDQQGYIVESDNAPAYSRPSHSRNGSSTRGHGLSTGMQGVKVYLGMLGVIILLFILWVSFRALPGLWLSVGVLAALSAIVLILCGLTWAIVSTIRHATKADFYPVEENGAYLRDSLGRVRPLAPMIAAPARVNKATAKIEITPVVPTLFDLIEQGEIVQGEMTMVMGYDKAQLARGILQLVVGAWPGTHAVAGKGRSGKTRRVIAMIAQALINGAKVLVCDPHYTKLDSLARSLEPLEKYLTIARGEEQIVSTARGFLGEMEARVDDANRPCTPWLIVFDEWSRLMDENNGKMEDGGRDILIDVAKNCSTQYAGYLGYCCIIGQIWTSDSVGGTDIRRSLQSVFVHQLSGEYAAFFFRAAKWKGRAEELKKRECIYRDTENQVLEVLTIGVPDDTAQRVAAYLASLGLQGIDAPAHETAQRLPSYQEPTGYIALDPPAQRAQLEDMESLPYYTSTPVPNHASEHETTIFLPEVSTGSAREAHGKHTGSDTEVQTEVLRSIAKRLRKGETANDIRKSLGLTGGRAMQEVNAALDTLSEIIASEGE